MKNEKVKKPFYKKWWVWVLAVIVVFAIIGGGGSSDNGDVNTSDTNVSTEAPGSATQKNPSNEIDDFVCEILGVEVGDKNHEGKPIVIVTYKFTNNSDEADSFDLSINHTVFQNGIECEQDFVYAVMDDDNGSKEIKTGASIEVKKAYILNDTSSDIEIELEGIFSWDDNVITKIFSIAN